MDEGYSIFFFACHSSLPEAFSKRISAGGAAGACRAFKATALGRPRGASWAWAVPVGKLKVM